MVHLTLGIEGREKQLGTGKTAFLTGLGYRGYCRGYRIAANYHLHYPYIPVGAVHQIDELRNCILLLDEGWSWIRSRTGGSEMNLVMDDILLSSRKRNCSIYYTQQVDTLMDRPVREITSEWVKTWVKDRIYPNMENGLPRYKYVIGEFQRTGLKMVFDLESIGGLYNTTEEVKVLVQDDEFFKPLITKLMSDKVFLALPQMKMKIQRLKYQYRLTELASLYVVGLIGVVQQGLLWQGEFE